MVIGQFNTTVSKQLYCSRFCYMVVLLCCVVTNSHAQILSSKRGFADVSANYSNLQATGATWYYTWGLGTGTPANFDALHYPMFWTVPSQTSINNTLAKQPAYILGFNEPERSDQANLSVASAIASWTTISNSTNAYNAANGTNIKLVSPAVSDTGGATGGQAWLSSFMSQANAANLKVDAIAFHWYGASTPTNPAGSASGFLSRVASYYNTYNKPIFITEFAIHDWAGAYTDAEIIEANRQFLDIVIPALESRSYVLGYSFYNWFSDSRLYSGTPATPTPMAYTYVGSLQAGDVENVAGKNLGEHVAYLAGGELTMTGTTAGTVRYINALANSSIISGNLDWGLTSSSNWMRIQSGATVLKNGTNQFSLTAGTFTNDGVLQISDGIVRLGISSTGSGRIELTSTGGATGSTARLELSNNITIPQAITYAQRNDPGASDGIRNISGNNTLSGPLTITVGGSQTRIRSDAGQLTISGALSTDATSARNLYLQGTGNGVISGIISDNATNTAGKINLFKEGTGTWTLSNTNTHTGTTTISGGVLLANSSAALGSGVASNTLIFNGGTLRAGGTIASPSTRGVTLTSTGTIDTNNNDLSIAGVISGASGLTKTGNGTLTLTGTNTYTGNTTVAAGTLAMGSNLIATSPTIVIGNGATLQAGTTNFNLAANQNITGTGTTGSLTHATLGISGFVTTSGSTFSTLGTLSISRLDVRGLGNQLASGNFISGGAASGQRGLLIGNTVASELTINTGATLTTQGATTSPDLIGNGLSGNGTLLINGGSYNTSAGTGTLFLGNTSNLGGGTLTVNSGAATIGTLGYQVGSSQSGIVNLNGGTLTLSNITATAVGTREFNFAGGQFIASANLSFPSLVNTQVKNGGAKIDTGNFAVTIPGALTNFAGTSTGGLTKTGTGTLTLSGINTYSGNTIVSAGTLELNRTSPGNAVASLVTDVANGATLRLAGTASGLSTNANVTNAGTLEITGTTQSVGNITGAGATTVSGAGTSATPTLIAKDIDQTSLTINNGAYVRLAASGSTPSVLTSLTLGTTANLDISNNDVVVNNPTPVAATSSLVAVAARVNAGFAGGAGIVTNTFTTNLETVGFALNDFLGFTNFSGTTVNPDSVLLKYTYFGDSNLDGFVTDDDLGYFLAGYGTDVSANPWTFGDYNHDGFTTDDDLGFFLAAYGSTPGLSNGIQTIPEPSLLVLGTLAGLGLCALNLRRHRRAM
jgi:autotransporter-associated beta strand protein